MGAKQEKPKRKFQKLAVGRTEDIPLLEVSGLCFRRGLRGMRQVVAIGDSAAVGAWAKIADEPGHSLCWKTANLRDFQGSRLPRKDSQIEAVCADGAGRLLLLQETPPRVELVSPPDRRVIASIDLQVPNGHPLAKPWHDENGSRGEGAVLLANGHLLVAKEKEPAALLEFGPANATASGFQAGRGRGGRALADGARWPVARGVHSFELLAAWLPNREFKRACRDFSDLEIGPDGRLYLLSDKSATIARVSDLYPAAGKARVERVWELPPLKGKPEGLAFTRGGHALVALDRRKPRRNLVMFEPAIAPPSR